MEERRSVQTDSNLDSSGNKNFVSKNERLIYAKWFLDRGFSIIPIDPQSKKPVVSNWQKYSNTPLTEEEKQKFLEMVQKGYNYAIPGGQKNLVILDFENTELLKQWIGESALNRLCQNTLCVSTPHGGLHIYLQSDEIPPHKLNPVFLKDDKGIADLQSYSSYVLGPGSCINHRTCSSDKCKWRGQDITDCYSLYNNELREIGKLNLKEFLKFLAERGKKLGIELSSSARVWLGGRAEEEDRLKEFEELRKELIKYDKGKSVERIKEEICAKSPPKVIKEVICEGKSYAEINIDRSRGDWRLVLYLLRHGVTDPEKILQLLPNDSKAKENEKWDTQKYFILTLSKAWNIVKKYLEAKSKIKEDKSTAKRLLIEAIAEEILHEHKLVTFVQRDQQKESVIGLFHYSRRKGIFEPFDVTIEKIINKKLEEYKEFPLGADKSRVVRNIKEEIMRRTQRRILSEPLRVAFKNGTLEWTEKGILWYDAKTRTHKQYAFHYVPWNLKIDELKEFINKEITIQGIEELARRLCPKSLEVFKQWVDDKWVLLFEIIGYTLYPRYAFHKIILLVGNGSNGKSTFLNLLLKILGKHNVSAVSLKRILSEDRFASAELFHKLANLSSELYAFTVINTDEIKKLTGEDYLQAERKYRDPFNFINYAKIINATNELPIVHDQTYGFWRRWLVIQFPHQFEPDPYFFEKTFTDEEIEGVLTVSILAFARVLIQQKKFDFEDSSADIKELWERKSDSVYAFMKEMIENDEVEYNPNNGSLFTPVKELYQRYVRWCEENDRKPEEQAVFTKRLETRFRITKDRKKINGERIWCYVGIRLKSENTEGNDQSNESNLLELYKQFQGRVISVKDLLSQLGLSAYQLIDWCGKKGLCHFVDEEHVRFE